MALDLVGRKSGSRSRTPPSSMLTSLASSTGQCLPLPSTGGPIPAVQAQTFHPQGTPLWSHHTCVRRTDSDQPSQSLLSLYIYILMFCLPRSTASPFPTETTRASSQTRHLSRVAASSFQPTQIRFYPTTFFCKSSQKHIWGGGRQLLTLGNTQ